MQHNMWEVYLQHLLNSPHILLIAAISFLFSLYFYRAFKNSFDVRRKAWLLYSHIFFLLFPLLASLFMWSCTMPFYQCTPKITVYAITGIATTGFLLSILILPYIYNWSSGTRKLQGHAAEFATEQSRILGIPTTAVYLADEARPYAYSLTHTRPSIYLSSGLCDILTKKELEAVLLHELYHVKNNTSLLKFSTRLLRYASPLAGFISSDEALAKEEHDADTFAIKKQSTARHLRSAKRKVQEWQAAARLIHA